MGGSDELIDEVDEIKSKLESMKKKNDNVADSLRTQLNALERRVLLVEASVGRITPGSHASKRLMYYPDGSEGGAGALWRRCDDETNERRREIGSLERRILEIRSEIQKLQLGESPDFTDLVTRVSNADHKQDVRDSMMLQMDKRLSLIEAKLGVKAKTKEPSPTDAPKKAPDDDLWVVGGVVTREPPDRYGYGRRD